METKQENQQTTNEQQEQTEEAREQELMYERVKNIPTQERTIWLISPARIRAASDFRVGDAYMRRLNEEVLKMVERSEERTEKNKRVTMRAEDV